MLLVVTATEIEMAPFKALTGRFHESFKSLVCGVGPVESAVSLSCFLGANGGEISRVLNFGVAGAYMIGEEQARILDICLAEDEVLGDSGLCFEDHIEPLSKELAAVNFFPLDSTYFARATEVFREKNMFTRSGSFVTVSSASATERRGNMLAARFQGLCENMEGAAIARVCQEFSLPLLELRAISNLVEDRDLSRWQLQEACGKAAEAAALLLTEKVI